jgi:hypothetical protein
MAEAVAPSPETRTSSRLAASQTAVRDPGKLTQAESSAAASDVRTARRRVVLRE